MTNPLFDIEPKPGEYICPWCDERHDCSLGFSDPDATPKPGDVVVCHECAQPSIIQEVGKPRRPTEQEWKSINTDQSLTEIRKFVFMSNKGNVNRHVMDAG